MTTALDLITGAARLIGVVFKSEALDSDEANDGLNALNDMIASWSNNGLLIVSRVRETFALSSGSSFTIGSGQTLNTVRPVVIRYAYIRNGGVDYPLTQLNDEEYESIGYKSTATNFPQYFNYDNAYPYGTIRLFPALSTSGAELHLLSEKPLGSIAALTTTVDLPSGWKRAIRSNLALEIASEYGVEVTPGVVKMAADSLGNISLAIAKNRALKFMRPVTYRYDIYGDV